ncbi:hypothetical protein [Sphingobium yanoikuyae]|uniref:hypothetical protein n=1 Tax=Sphingobium yanoikuyae TaxID=13690 RepID=UPI0035AEE433
MNDRCALIEKIYLHNLSALAEEFNIVLVYPIPEAGWNVPQYIMKRALFHEQFDDVSTA